MARSSSPLLHLVNPDTGEVTEEACPHCVGKETELKELERKMRGLARELGELRRDKEAEARAHEKWPTALAIFNYWRRECGHPKAEWGASRFWLIEPFLSRYGVEPCLRAVAGAAFDPFTTKRKNGSVKRHDGMELIFRDAGKFEEFANRAARDWTVPDELLELVAA